MTEKRKAKAMRAARHRRKWSQFDLAQRVGCSESQIAKIETGRLQASPELKQSIARELGIATWEVGNG